MMEYSELVRARMVRRMVGPGAIAATELSRETGIPQPTLSRWLRGAASLRLVSIKQEASSDLDGAAPEPKRPQDWSPMERMQFVLEADGLGDQEMGELLRRRGVHREQLDAWRTALAEAFAQPTASRRSSEGKRIKALEREVARKDKALAETAALLVLQKKVQLLFPDGVYVGDDTDEGSDE
jgi:transposase